MLFLCLQLIPLIMRIKMRTFYLSILSVLILNSCWESKNERPDTAIDTGTTFIRASLDGDFKKAELLILPDSQNQQLFDSYKRYYEHLSKEQKDNYKKASYEINKLSEQTDSTTLINYSNSYMKKPMEIRVIQQNKQWFVDFKYTYTDELQKPSAP